MNRLDPSRSVLVLVDIQEKLFAAMPEHQKAEILRASAVLLEAAKQMNVRVLVTEQYPQGLGHTVAPIADKLASMGVTAIEKMTFSALDEPAFQKALHAGQTKHVIIVGMESHICVFQTARDMCALGLDVHVPIDGVASRRDDHREAGLRLCERAGALRSTAETIAFDWLVRAGGDAFKAVSKAVR